MARRILLHLVLMMLLAYTGRAQKANLTGADIAMEGSVHKYILSYSGPVPSNVNLQWSITNGTVVASNTNPTAGAIYADVRWDFFATRGTVTITETNTGYFLDKSVEIHPIYEQVPWWTICNEIAPVEQQVSWNATPLTLSITNCVQLPSPAPYIIEYQWEYAMYDPANPASLTWISIWNGTSADYTPDVFLSIGVKVFRRKTKIWDNAHTVLHTTITSNMAFARLNPIDAGTIYSTTFPGAAVIVPFATAIGGNRVSANPATGGICSSYNYVWEIAYEGMPWTFLGNGEQFPGASVLVNNLIRLRRKVTCGTDVAYSNHLVIDPDYTSPWEENRNYVRTNVLLKAGVYGWFEADALPVGDKLQTTVYYDGQGRPIQEVKKDGACENCETSSPLFFDVVAHLEYDAAGRSPRDYLPYPTTYNAGKFKDNAAADQPQVMRSFFNETSQAPTWTQVTYEQAPMSRVTNLKIGGSSWGGNSNYAGITNVYGFNNQYEQIVQWNIGYASGDMPSFAGYYPVNTLIKSVSRNESDKRTIIYTDFTGRKILQKQQLKDEGPDLDENGHAGWLCTYYVYDDFNRLRYEISPRAVEWLLANSPGTWTLTTTIVEELCSYKEYDERGREVVRHSPGSGAVYMVYDKRNRLVLVQDALQRARPVKQWSYLLYDELDRPVVAGLVNYNSQDRNDVQYNYVNYLPLNTVTIPVLAGNLGSENVKVHTPVISSSCTGCGTNIVNSIHYYDNYNIPQKKSFNTSFNFPTSMPSNVDLTTAQSSSFRVLSMSTGDKVRVLNASYDDGDPSNDDFLIMNMYYDEKARQIQQIGQSYNNNGKGDLVMTRQYDFAGRVLANCEMQQAAGTTPSTFYVYTKYELDKLGRTRMLYKKFSGVSVTALADADMKKIAMYSYDKMGRLKQKMLAPGYNNPTTLNNYLETLNYQYNLHGWLTGINKNYVSSYNRTESYFGMHIGYDNRDGLLSNGLLNGKIAGIIYKSQDDVPRKYEYGYDNVGRLTNAGYNERYSSLYLLWDNSRADYSALSMQYDANGNLKQMHQKGVVPGQQGGFYIDKLSYSYENNEWSNRLAKVTDQGHGLGSNNGILGDFKDGANGGNDYEYDANGNLVKDLNKEINAGSAGGITYNYLNKPQIVIIDNKKRIEFIYDGVGNKLGKKVVDISGAGSPDKYTWYVSQFVYEQVAAAAPELQFVNHEEGRVRIIPFAYPPSDVIPYLYVSGNLLIMGSTKGGAYDYFVRDHLGSVRMILTEENHTEKHMATMETASAAYEEATFGNPGAGNEVALTRQDRSTTPWPAPSPGQSNSYVSKLYNVTGKRVGPNMLLKVMAGDVINPKVKYLFETVSNPDYSNIIGDITNSLVSTFISGGMRAKGYAKGFTSQLQSSMPASGGALQAYLNGLPAQSPGNAPRAYLHVLYFDELFNLIPDYGTGYGSISFPVTTAGSVQTIDVLQRAPANGYAFIFVSNHSTDAVYFDDLHISHYRGRILEENHYYPYGLKNASLTANAFDRRPNDYGYQGEWAEEEDITQWAEFDLRMYDPQVGRFTTQDPYEQFASPYTGMGNDPVSFSDPTGGFVGWEGALIGALAGAGIGNWIAVANKYSDLEKGLAIGGLALLGAGVGYSMQTSLIAIPANAEGGLKYLWLNFKAFYKGLVFVGEDGWQGTVIGKNLKHVEIPDIWGEWVTEVPIEKVVHETIFQAILSSTNTGIKLRIVQGKSETIKDVTEVRIVTGGKKAFETAGDAVPINPPTGPDMVTEVELYYGISEKRVYPSEADEFTIRVTILFTDGTSVTTTDPTYQNTFKPPRAPVASVNVAIRFNFLNMEPIPDNIKIVLPENAVKVRQMKKVKKTGKKWQLFRFITLRKRWDD